MDISLHSADCQSQEPLDLQFLEPSKELLKKKHDMDIIQSLNFYMPLHFFKCQENYKVVISDPKHHLYKHLLVTSASTREVASLEFGELE